MCGSKSNSSCVTPKPRLHLWGLHTSSPRQVLVLLGASLDVVTFYCENRFSVLPLARCEALWEILQSLISPQSLTSLNKSGKTSQPQKKLAPSPFNYRPHCVVHSIGGYWHLVTWLYRTERMNYILLPSISIQHGRENYVTSLWMIYWLLRDIKKKVKSMENSSDIG